MPAKDIRSRRAASLRYARKRRADAAARGIPATQAPPVAERSRFGARLHLPIEDGCVFVVSDAHYWRGSPSLAHRAAVHLAKRLRPVAIINNGDSLDGSSISRYEPQSFVNLRSRMTVEEELAAQTRHLRDFEDMKFVKWRTWNQGNHDSRFETLLATKVPQYNRVQGFHLKDHYPSWLPAWTTWINGEVVVKHRFKGGLHAALNNALWSGKTFVTGHDHMLYVRAMTDLNGTRFGVAAGTLQDIYAEPFQDYTEDSPVCWQSGFVILTFRSGRLTVPETVHALPDGRVVLRGEVIKVPGG